MREAGATVEADGLSASSVRAIIAAMTDTKPGLGDRVEEIVTKRQGTVTGRCEYLWGCEQLLVYVDGEKDKDGDPKSSWFDISRLIVLERGAVAAIDYELPDTFRPRRHLSTALAAGPDRPAPTR